MQEISASFIRNLIPEDNRLNAIVEIAALLEKEAKLSAQDFKEAKLKVKAMNYYNQMAAVVEFLDKGVCGFLTGDITPKLLMWMERLVGEYVKKLETQAKCLALTTEKRNYLLTELYQKIFKVCTDGLFKLPVNGIPFPDSENPRNLFERQLILEDESNNIAMEKFIHTYDSMQNLGLTHNYSFARSHMIRWFPDLCKAIKLEQEMCMLPGLVGDRATYGPVLLRLSPEKIALITLSELMKMIMSQATKRNDDESQKSLNNFYIISKLLFQTIGKTIAQQIHMDQEEQEIIKYIQTEMAKPNLTARGKSFLLKRSEMLKKSATERIVRGRVNNRTAMISQVIQYQLGSLMVYLTKETAKVQNNSELQHNLITLGYMKADPKQLSSTKIVGVCRINEDFLLSVIRDIEKQDSLFIQLDRCLPMIYKPAPWTDYEIGGYYQKPTNVMRVEGSAQQERAVKSADMSRVFNVLDTIAKLPWRINQKVLDVVEDIWSLGGGVGEMPSRYYDFKDYIYQYQVNECKDSVEKRRMVKAVQMQRDVHSLRCSFSLRLDQARAFSKVKKFYYPHNLDFRGRTYPIPPHLNHMSNDFCRGILEFGEGKPLGSSGLRWLFIHLSNKMGKDKLKLDDREAYGRSLMPIVNRVAKDPINNREWLEVEDCWQALAAMFEVYAAVNSPDPEKFVSYMHVHQDGSCNGLQHYAALGRDYEGAYQVNLVNRDIPGDIYTHVANMVEEQLSLDVVNTEAKYHEMAKKLSGNVKRKVIKQTVMTTVYGVTFIGAKAQIQKQIQDKDFIDQTNDAESYIASMYLAKLTLNSVENLFNQAHQIKQWLKDCSKSVVAAGHPISWLTPLGYRHLI